MFRNFIRQSKNKNSFEEIANDPFVSMQLELYKNAQKTQQDQEAIEALRANLGKILRNSYGKDADTFLEMADKLVGKE